MRSASLVATVDRFETSEEGEELAVLVFDDGQQLIVPHALFPWLRRGMVLRVRFERDEETEEVRRREVSRLQEELFGDEDS